MSTPEHIGERVVEQEQISKFIWLFHFTWVLGLLGYHFINPLRVEHLLLIAVVIVAWSIRPIMREFVVVFMPLMLYGMFYDLLRVLNAWAHERVVIKPVRELELALFGWYENGALVGPVEYFQQYNHALVDLVGGVWYASHVATIILFGLYLWWNERTLNARGDTGYRLSRIHCFLWGFLGVNLVGFLIQISMPVAPPWYVDIYGYAQPAMILTGDPAGLSRIDTLLNIQYFQGVYEKAAYVMGAVPSLHVVYPIWLALFTRRWWSRLLAGFYAAMMGFFAVYFTHHYLVDLLAGAILAVVFYYLITKTALRHVPNAIYRWFEHHFLCQT